MNDKLLKALLGAACKAERWIKVADHHLESCWGLYVQPMEEE